MKLPCCLRSSPVIVRQQLDKHVPAAMNTHATIEELLVGLFSMLSMFIGYSGCSERNAGD
jgi:hypothetical protein